MIKSINYILNQLSVMLAVSLYSYSLLADPIAAIAVDPTGKVGVGTQNPSTQLDVNGDVNIKGKESSSTTLTVNSPISFSGKDKPTIRLQNPDEKDVYYLSLYSYSPGPSYGGWAFKLRSYWGGNDSILSLDPKGTGAIAGRVGINTIEPATALHVKGDVTVDGNPSATTSLTVNSPQSFSGKDKPTIRLQNPDEKDVYYLSLYSYSPGPSYGGWAFKLRSYWGGNDSILSLDPKGTGAIAGRVGINTIEPATALHVKGDVTVDGNPSATTSLIINSPKPFGGINSEVVRFQNPNKDKDYYYLTLYPYAPEPNYGSWSFKLNSYLGGNTNILTLDPRRNNNGYGRVGINTLNPQSALDVNGGQIALRGVNGHYAIFEVNKEDNGFPRLEISLYTKDSKLKSKDTLTKDGWLSSKNSSSQLTKKVAEQQKTIESLIKRIEMLEKKVKKQSK